jgi:tetratricopeptide (TPR) repeat protein
MKMWSGPTIVVWTGLALGGCAASGGGGEPPLFSPTGTVYEPGNPPVPTPFSQGASLSIARAGFEEALAIAREGMAADPTNPIHYSLAGDAAVGLGEYALADSLWTVAERIYPAYQLEIEPSRESAWGKVFEAGFDAYNAGNTAGAIEAWKSADRIYRFRPEAAQNLATVLSQERRYDEAAATYERALESIVLLPGTRLLDAAGLAEREETRFRMEAELAKLYVYLERYADAEPLLRRAVARNPADIEAQANLATALGELDRPEEARAIYTQVLDSPSLSATDLFNIGVALYTSEEYARSATAFGRVVDLVPDHRDALLNQVNALYRGEIWQELIAVAPRLLRVDPLNQDAHHIMVRALVEEEQSEDARSLVAEVEQLPVRIADLLLTPTSRSSTIEGRVIGHAAEAGTPIRLRFTFLAESGTLGTRDVTLVAPARDQSETFRVDFGRPAGAFKYEVAEG